jgi:signal transduction histidine kinase
LLEAKNIDYSIDIEPSIKNVKLSMSYRQHIYLILKEAINNLIKYSNCTKAYIGVVYYHNVLEITVQDNGVGFDVQSIKYGNGIMNMQQRAKQMNADLLINSRTGEGTKISIRIKIK